MSARFADTASLRRLLEELHQAGPGGWANSAEADGLMRFTLDRYGALARKHGQEPADAAVAAFEAMRTTAVLTADDPWAVVTRAVQVALSGEERAAGLLCSVARVWDGAAAEWHDAERFSEREAQVYDYHPAFHVFGGQERVLEKPRPTSLQEEPTNAYQALDMAVAIFVSLGWPRDAASNTLEFICSRLIEARTRSNAHEYLRRDLQACALLDLSRGAWAAVLRAVLGSPNPVHAHTAAGRGLLLRLMIDERPAELLADDDLVEAISSSAPSLGSRCA